MVRCFVTVIIAVNSVSEPVVSDKWLLVRATSQGNIEGSDGSVRINSDYVWGVSTSDYCEFTYTYDKNGNMLTMDCVSETGKTETRVWTYDENGWMLSYVRTNFAGNTWRTDYTYDKSGNRLTQDKLNYDGSVNNMETVYDGNGQKVSETVFESALDRTTEYSWTYHGNGETATEKAVVYREDGGIGSTTEITYNTAGDILTKITTASTGVTEEVYDYDSAGNLLVYELLYDGVSAGKEVSTYDDDGKILTKEGGLFGFVTYEYDDKGNLAREIGNGGTTVYEYPNPTHGVGLKPHVTLRDAIGDLPVLKSGQARNLYECSPYNEFLEFVRKNVAETVEEHAAPKNGAHLIRIMEALKDGQSKDDLPEDIRPKSGYGNTYAKLWWERPSTTITRNFACPSSSRCIHPSSVDFLF